MKLFLLILALSFIPVLPVRAEENGRDKPVIEDLTLKNEDGATHVFHVEIAQTPYQLMKGLMYRSEMADDAGMLFIFDGEEDRNFWMKNTYLPLDIVFIKGDGRISHIHKGAKPQDLTTLPSKGPVSRVLEINAGLADKLGLGPGTTVYNKTYFGNELAE